MSTEQDAFYNLLKEATDVSKPQVSITLLEDSEEVFVGSYFLQTIDMKDISAVGTSRDFVSSSGLLAHEIKEQILYQRGGFKGDFGKDHNNAILTGENLVNGSIRMPDIPSPSFRLVNSYDKTFSNGKVGKVELYSGLLNFQYHYGGKINTISLLIEKNNIIGLY